MNAPKKSAPTVAAVQGGDDDNPNVVADHVNTAPSTDTLSFLAPKLDNIPDALKAQPWAVWIAEPRPDKPGKFNKAPRCPKRGHRIGTNQPEKFGTFTEAEAAYKAGGYTGVGVLLTGNGIIGVDIDYFQETFTAQPAAAVWVKAAIKDGAYCEKSPSGNGLRLFVLGELPSGKRKSGPLEIYDDVRFLTVTGHSVGSTNGGE